MPVLPVDLPLPDPEDGTSGSESISLSENSFHEAWTDDSTSASSVHQVWGIPPGFVGEANAPTPEGRSSSVSMCPGMLYILKFIWPATGHSVLLVSLFWDRLIGH